MKENTRQSSRLRRLALAALATCIAPAGPVVAQDDETALEEIVVTGYRQSLAAALDVKRNSTNAVDSIMAEDIADFPDSNLAESLQRIPGISITRQNGEGRNITVRGLDSKFTRVTINDTMAQSIVAGQSNRSFDFNIFASELFNRVDVYKSTSAEMEEGSLGATVALQTGRPFDYDPFTVAANLQASYNDLSEETKPRASGLVSWSNDRDTFGALLSISYSERFVGDFGPQSGRFENDVFGSCSACGGDTALEAQVYDAYHPRFPRYIDGQHDQERTGVTTTFQFQPRESTLITADILYATIDQKTDSPALTPISLARTGATGVDETDVAAFTLDGPTIIAATMDGMDVRAENFVGLSDSEFTQYALRLDQDLGERARMKLLYATSEGEFDETQTTLIYEHFSPTDPRRLATYADPGSAHTYDFSNMTSPTIAFDWDVTNPANWEMSEFRDRIFTALSEFDSLQLGFDYDLSDDMTLKVGYSNKEYGFERFESRADRNFSGSGSADEQDGTVDGVACGVPSAIDSSMGHTAINGPVTWFAPNESVFNTLRGSGCWPQAVNSGGTRDVVEDDDAFYLQLDFTGDIAGMGLRGNLGVREVTTKLASTGITNVGGDFVQVTVNNKYTDTLPAINLALDINQELVARFGWAKVMSRPDLGLLSPSGSVTIFGIPAVSFNNPLLDPYRADNLDVALEWYFDDSSLLALAYFEKDIESFPDREGPVLVPFREIGLPESVLGAQRDDLIDEDFLVTRSVNGGGARLDGWEIQYQQQFHFLPGIWENTGVNANYTWVDSKIDESGLPMTGQSDDSYNLTVYYDDDRFSTRLAYSYRGEFNLSNNPTNPDAIQYRDATGYLDFSASYQVTDSVRVTLEAINLTDEPQTDWMSPNVGGRLIGQQLTGTQWFIGASYRLQ